MDMLEELLGRLAAEEKRDVQILERRGPAADHPVSASCLESHYLKCLIARVHEISRKEQVSMSLRHCLLLGVVGVAAAASRLARGGR